jgi:hypothetical protein
MDEVTGQKKHGFSYKVSAIAPAGDSGGVGAVKYNRTKIKTTTSIKSTHHA